MNRKLKITFILPGAGYSPVGGYKVVYEYANRLSRKGHDITVVHPAYLQKRSGPKDFARSMARYVYRRTIAGYTPERWFAIEPSVRLLWVPFPSARYVPDGDVVIATAWQTAEWVADYAPSKGSKVSLIQGLETWDGLTDRVFATWRSPWRRFAISQWLIEIARNMGEDIHYQPNGLDFQRFVLTNPPESRDRFSVLMLYHPSKNKGSAEGLRALSIVHEQVPELRVTLFGTPSEPPNLPSWIKYHRLPQQKLLCELYNSNAIFVTPSWTEGWALPPAEAMMCGAALVATDIGGHRDYGIHEQTALLSPPKTPDLLAANILRLVKEDALRTRLAHAGYNYIQQFTWERSIEQLETALLKDSLSSANKGNIE
jgi:glycosyltransferase involved in cell wall biosynthesis